MRLFLAQRLEQKVWAISGSRTGVGIMAMKASTCMQVTLWRDLLVENGLQNWAASPVIAWCLVWTRLRALAFPLFCQEALH